MPHGGSEKLFKTKKELDDKIEAYFKYCDEVNKPYTMSGLAVYLGTCRQTVINYGKSDLHFDSIKKAKARVEAYAEEKLYRESQVTGIIFNLKENFGWKDKVETEHTGSLDVGLIERAIVDAGKKA